MTSETVRTVNTHTQEILADTKKDEHLRELLNKYVMHVRWERKHQDELRAVLCELATLKDGNSIELLIDERVTDLIDEIGHAQKDQGYVVEEITSHARWC